MFVYALLKSDASGAIQYRVLDTAIGAALAFLGILIFWPSWESAGMEKLITESIEANQEYLKEITHFYRKKNQVPTTYKLSRKRAFLAMGNLSAAFQRMTQEPKSKQKNLDKIFEIAVLNHSILSSLASLGTYIQNNKTTTASSHFHNYILLIDSRLTRIIEFLEEGNITKKIDLEHKDKAEAFFAERLDSFRINNKFKNTSGDRIQGLREAQLVYEQLRWLLDLSTKLEKKIQKISF